MMPGVPKAKVQSRVILTPEHAKRLLQALGEMWRVMSRTFGDVQTHEPPQVLKLWRTYRSSLIFFLKKYEPSALRRGVFYFRVCIENEISSFLCLLMALPFKRKFIRDLPQLEAAA
jgi:hypothetical protein